MVGAAAYVATVWGEITCICRNNREDVAEDAAMAVLYPRLQVAARSHHQHKVRTSQTLLKTLPAGTCANHAALTSKTGTRPSHAPQRGADPTTQKDSRGLTETNTSIKGGIHAPNQCTKQNSREFDKVG
jgi:hypothetical protein